MITMAILFAVAPSSYGIDIEYQPGPANSAIPKYEDLIEVILAIQESGNIPGNVKLAFMTPYLEKTDNRPFILIVNNSQEISPLSIWEEKSISGSNIKSGNTLLALKEKHGPERVKKNSSPEKRIDRAQKDNKSFDGIFGYSIQVNSYKQKANAEDLIKRLKSHNYESFFSKIYDPLTKEIHYRVFVGKYNDWQSAKKTCELLKKKNDFTENIFVVDQNWVMGK